MKIVHLCLSNWFVDGFGYQENCLVREHVDAGHEVLVIASTEIARKETHKKLGDVTYIQPGEYILSEGARIIRLPYRRLGPHALMKKIRSYSGVYERLTIFGPDVILFHGTCSWELLTAAKYVRLHPHCALYVDSHGDWNNSARSFLSREVLHRWFYGSVLQRAMPQVQKVLCVSTESIDFCNSLYKLDFRHLEFFPLGGRPIPDEEYIDRRARTRADLGVDKSDFVFIQSGRQAVNKKLLETLRAFCRVVTPKNRLVIVGAISSDIKVEAMSLINSDHRVIYLGWASFDRLTDLLCAADVYVQPGTQSATMQHSMCCRCAIAIDDVRAHDVYHNENGWLLNKMVTLEQVFQVVLQSSLEIMQHNSYTFAKNNLDYKVLAQRVLV